MSCNMCGQCCRMIHMENDQHRYIQNGKQPIGAFKFVQENWEYIGTSREVGGFVSHGGEKEYYIYKCKLITEDNKCSIHKNKPYVCSGYPWYDNKIQTVSTPWPYKGCGYERISYEMRLLSALKYRIDQLSSKQGE